MMQNVKSIDTAFGAGGCRRRISFQISNRLDCIVKQYNNNNTTSTSNTSNYHYYFYYTFEIHNALRISRLATKRLH